MLPIALLILLDFVALGMLIPLSPYLARELGASEIQVGFLMSTYSAVQLIFTPLCTTLSDKWGRKPFFLLAITGSLVSYLWFALATHLLSLFFSRMLAGLCGSVLALGMAGIADRTPPSSDRSKSFGIAGGAVGLGFVIGPFLGAFLSVLGKKWGDTPPLGSQLSAFGSFIVCTLSLILALFCFKDKKLSPSALKEKSAPLEELKQRWKDKTLEVGTVMLWGKWLAFATQFLLSVSMSVGQVPLFLYVKDQFTWSHANASLGFAYIGLVMVFTQGFLVRRVVPMFGEVASLTFFLLTACGGATIIAFFPTLTGLAVGVTFLAMGHSFSTTCLSGILSFLSHNNSQGQSFGIQHSLFSLSRITGPILGTWFYKMFNPQAPFLASSILFALVFLLILKIKVFFPSSKNLNNKNN